MNHDFQRERARAKAHRDLHAERLTEARSSIRRKVACGLVLGSFFYLLVSCFGNDVITPKIDRKRFKFRHDPSNE